MGQIPESGRSFGSRHGNSPQYSCLENPMDRGNRQAVVHRVTESDTTDATQQPPMHTDKRLIWTVNHLHRVTQGISGGRWYSTLNPCSLTSDSVVSTGSLAYVLPNQRCESVFDGHLAPEPSWSFLLWGPRIQYKTHPYLHGLLTYYPTYQSQWLVLWFFLLKKN